MDYSAQQHIARVGVQASNFYLEGDVVVPAPVSYRSRLCDVLNRGEQFLAVTNATVYREGREEADQPEYREVLIIRKDQIQYAVPLD